MNLPNHIKISSEDEKTTHIILQNKDEQAVWDRFLKGDKAALSYIYRTWARPLYNFGRQFSKHEVVQDCIQDLFYDLIRARHKLGQCTSVRAYLYASLRRKILRATQKLRHEVDQGQNEAETAFRIAFVPEKTGFAHEELVVQKEQLQQACNQLPPRQREIILLYYFEEFSYQEIMQIMEFDKVSSARTLVYRALNSLRKQLAGNRNNPF